MGSRDYDDGPVVFLSRPEFWLIIQSVLKVIIRGGLPRRGVLNQSAGTTSYFIYIRVCGRIEVFKRFYLEYYCQIHRDL